MRDGAQIDLDATEGKWHSDFQNSKNGAEQVLLVPVATIYPKKGKELHLKPGDEILIEPAAEIRTTIDNLTRPFVRL